MSEFTTGLRYLAEFLDNHPEIQTYLGQHTKTEINLFPPDEPRAMASVARAFGSCEKKWMDTLLVLAKDFGDGVTLRALFARDAVCVKKVIGQKLVPAEPEVLIPAKPERLEDIVEWECSEPSLLAPREDDPPQGDEGPGEPEPLPPDPDDLRETRAEAREARDYRDYEGVDF
jgi:hypothetical protein